MSAIYRSHEVSPALADRLKRMPKFEIHVHLEGATDADTVWNMAQTNGIPLPARSLDEWRAFYEFRDFNHCLEIYRTATRCMVSADDYFFMVERFIQRQAAQNVRCSEVYFSPQHHRNRKLTPREILDALEAGAESGRRTYGSTVRFIADISRHGADGQTEVLQFALDGRERNGLFIGLGVGGAEVGYPPELFKELFARARDAGLRVVAHAGETEGAASIWGALRHLQAERIGHGVRSIEDERLVAHLARTQVPVEVSPNSNYCLKVVPLDQPPRSDNSSIGVSASR